MCEQQLSFLQLTSWQYMAELLLSEAEVVLVLKALLKHDPPHHLHPRLSDQPDDVRNVSAENLDLATKIYTSLPVNSVHRLPFSADDSNAGSYGSDSNAHISSSVCHVVLAIALLTNRELYRIMTSYHLTSLNLRICLLIDKYVPKIFSTPVWYLSNPMTY